MAQAKTTTMRLEEELFRELAFVARADRTGVSDAVRTAVGKHIGERLADEKVQDRLAQLIQEDAALLKRLSGR